MRLAVFGVTLLAFSLLCSCSQPADPYAPGRIDEDLSTPGLICEVHQLPLVPDKVSIQYGKPRQPSSEELKMKQDLYPHANSSVSAGGCVVNESKLWAKVSYCPECRKAEDKHRVEEMQKWEASQKEAEMKEAQKN